VVRLGSFCVFDKDKIQPHRHIRVHAKQVPILVERKGFARAGDNVKLPKCLSATYTN